MKSASLLLLMLLCHSATAQNFNPDSVSQLNKRFGFANMYVGLEGLATSPGSAPVLNSANKLENVAFAGYAVPRLVWGGTHFWGHADFYVAFPLGGYAKPAPAPLASLVYDLGVETGLKAYLWRLRTGTVRPYLGLAWNISSFQQAAPGAPASIELAQNTTPVLAGISYRGKRVIVEAGAQYFFKNNYKYPVSRVVSGDLMLPQFAFTINVKYLLETTYQKGAFIKKRMAALVKHRKFSAFYVGIGPSASIGIPTFSEYDRVNYPFFENHKRYIGVVPDLTAGYYFSRPNLNIGLSCRNMADSYEGFGVQHVHERKSVMLEVYKFLGDYHGFVPYVGITASSEQLFFATRDLSIDNAWNTYAEHKSAVGIICGWDIRPTKAESWLLRTNLRYTPVSMTVDGKKVAYDYIEFNFIQLVLFPERMVAQYRERGK